MSDAHDGAVTFQNDPSLRRLTWIQRATHFELLMSSEEMGPLPDAPIMSAFLAGMYGDTAPDAATIQGVYEALWSRGPRGWTNERIELERGES